MNEQTENQASHMHHNNLHHHHPRNAVFGLVASFFPNVPELDCRFASGASSAVPFIPRILQHAEVYGRPTRTRKPRIHPIQSNFKKKNVVVVTVISRTNLFGVTLLVEYSTTSIPTTFKTSPFRWCQVTILIKTRTSLPRNEEEINQDVRFHSRLFLSFQDQDYSRCQAPPSPATIFPL